MDTNLFHKYQLPPALFGSAHALPCNPLQLVATPDDGDTGPLLVIGYDWYQDRRVLAPHMPRTKNFATHVTTALLPGPGQEPIRKTFGAACFVEYCDGQNFIFRNPHLAHQAAFFEELDSIRFSPFKLLHPSIRQSYEGALNDESWRFFDSCMSLRLTDKQFKNAAAAIEKWHAKVIKYQVMGLTNPNCQEFVKHIVREARISTPLWWGKTPWPGIDARLLELNVKINNDASPWLLQSRAITRLMAQDLLPMRGEDGEHFYAEPAKAAYAVG